MLANLFLLLCAHPNSSSSSSVVVQGAHVAVEIRAQARALAEALPVDLDRDGKLDAAELAQASARFAEYLADHYRLYADGTRIGERDAALPQHYLGARVAEARSGDTEEWITLEFEANAAAALAELSLEVKLFYEQNPYHTDQCSIDWNGKEKALWIFPEQGDRWRFEPEAKRRPSVFFGFLRLGVEHILTGYDHLAFLFALLLAAARLRSIIGVVTAFTIAHSITLASAALGFVRVDPSWVEMAIALSIAYVACLNLMSKKPAARWLEAFGFGLVHGLGFASAVADSLIVEKLKLTALFAFNVGVELGQLSVVVVASLVIARLARAQSQRTAEAEFLAPAWLRRYASAVIVALGLFWFTQRAGWIG